MNKTCSKCSQTKDISQFYKGKNYADGYMTWCKQCHYDYYHKDPERKKQINEAVKDWYKRNKSHKKATDAIWYEKNKEKVKAHKAEYRKNKWATDPEHRERKNATKRESILRRLGDALFVKKRQGWRTMASEHRRARKNSVENTLTTKEWKEICDKYDNKCLCCGKKKKLTIDHVIPISKGGSHTAENVQPLCMTCNHRKYTKTIDYRP